MLNIPLFHLRSIISSSSFRYFTACATFLVGNDLLKSSGRGQFSMEFGNYAPCPKNVAEEVIAEAKERQAAAAK